MKSVFILQHLHLTRGEESVTIVGAYRTRESAKAAVERLRSKPGFSEPPNLVDTSNEVDDQGFYIDEYPLDEDQSVGFMRK